MKSRIERHGCRQRGLVALFLWCLVPVALAHPGHADAGATGGLLHPLTGLDHLLAMTAAGLLSGRHLRRPFHGVLAFMLAFAAGLVLAGPGGVLPGLENILIASVSAAGLLLWRLRRVPERGLLGGLALIAFLHGLAHGFEAPGSQAYAWAAGALITVFLVTTVAAVGGHFARARPALLRGAGLGLVGMGLFLFGA